MTSRDQRKVAAILGLAMAASLAAGLQAQVALEPTDTVWAVTNTDSSTDRNTGRDWTYYDLGGGTSLLDGVAYYDGTTLRWLRPSETLSTSQQIGVFEAIAGGHAAGGLGAFAGYAFAGGVRSGSSDDDLWAFNDFSSLPFNVSVNGSGHAFPDSFVTTPNRMYFLATQNEASADRELFTVTGSAGSFTALRLTNFAAADSGLFSIGGMVAVGDDLYFTVKKRGTGTPTSHELWRTNGTTAGTTFLRRLDGYAPGSGDPNANTWWGGNAVRFSEGNERLLMDPAPSSAATPSQTIEFWVKPRDPNTTTQVLATFGSTDASRARWEIQLVGNRIRVVARSASSPTTPDITESNSFVPANRWTHVAVVLDSPNSVIYLNSVTDRQFQISGPLNPVADPICIGGTPSGTTPFSGEMDEFRVWGDARTPEEISSNWRRTIQGAQPDLLFNYTMDSKIGVFAGIAPDFLVPNVGGSAVTISGLGTVSFPEIVPTSPLAHDPVTNRIFVAGHDLGNGVEPWAYDIAANTAQRFASIAPGDVDAFPGEFTPMGDGTVAFVANPRTGQPTVQRATGAPGVTPEVLFTNTIIPADGPALGLGNLTKGPNGELAFSGNGLVGPDTGRRIFVIKDGAVTERVTNPGGDSDPVAIRWFGGSLWYISRSFSNRHVLYEEDCAGNSRAILSGSGVNRFQGPRQLSEAAGRLITRMDNGSAMRTHVAYPEAETLNRDTLACDDRGANFAKPATASGLFGFTVSGVGDVNGDGYEDVLIADPSATGAATSTGAVYLALGNAAGDFSDATRYITIQGLSPNDYFGDATSGAGDFNGDGLADFIIGAPQRRNGTANAEGEAYLHFGSRTRYAPGSSFLASDTASGRGVRFRGFSGVAGRVGHSVAGVGNLNGDRNPANSYPLDDIVIGAPGLDGGDGNSFIVYGNRNLPAVVNLSQLGSNGVRIRALNNTGQLSSHSVAGVGDVNGDGLPEVAFGPTEIVDQINRGYLLYGNAAGFPTSLDLLAPPSGTTVVQLTLSDGPPMTETFTESQSVAPAGDVNGDGLADFIIRRPDSLYPGPTTFGRTYLVYGSFDTLGLNNEVRLENIFGDQNGDGNAEGAILRADSGLLANIGYAKSIAGAGDLNADGYGDILIGNVFLDFFGSFAPAPATPRSHIVWGRAAQLTGFDVPAASDPNVAQLVTSEDSVQVIRDSGDEFTAFRFKDAVSAAGDVNGDGLSDVIFGHTFSGSGDPGAAVIFGRPVATEATYTNYIRSGVTGAGGITNVKLPAEGVGASGDGRFSTPLSRVTFAFEGGGTGANSGSSSRQQVTLRRFAPPQPNPQWRPMPVHWQVLTDRETNSIAPVDSTMTFTVTEAELAGFDIDRVAFFKTSDDPPTATSTWTPIAAAYDETRRTFSITRTHNAGSMATAINGAYGIFEINEEYELGEEIVKPQAVQDAIDAGQLTIFDPEVTPAGAAFWHAGTNRLYATAPSQPVEILWRANDQSVIASQIVNTVWPDESKFQLHVSGTPPVSMTDGGRFQTIRLMATDVGNPSAVDKTRLEAQREYVADGINGTRTGEGRAFVMLALDTDPRTSPIYFLPVRTVAWNNTAYGTDPTVFVGDTVFEAALHTDTTVGPFVFFERAYYNAGANYHNRATRTGPIIPVNTDLDPTTPDDNLVVAYYQRSAKIVKALEQQNVTSTLSFPHVAARYDVEWDPAAPEIVIASLASSGVLDSLGTQLTLYVQNTRSLPGFNPNEEHAVILSNTAYALRDDLNVTNSSNLATNPNTSAPYVLVQFLDTNGKRAMKAIEVLASNAQFDFTYDGKAGTRVQAPVPLSILSPTEPCPDTATPPAMPNGSYLVSGAGFVDRKGELWALSGADNATPTNNPPVPLVFRYFYATQPGFFIPGASPEEVAPGTCLPWLDRRAGTPGQPIDITYNITWPDDAPELRYGETLITAKNGLPDVGNRISAAIAYDQSIANGGPRSVLFYEPLREYRVSLASLPAGLPTEQQGPRIVFPTLEPALKARLFYDPTASELVLRGFYVTEDTPEPYVLPNVITDRDFNYLTSSAVSTDGAWATAIAALPGTTGAGATSLVGTPSAQVKALTSTTRAEGYVTLIFENDSLVPVSTPISMEVIRVTCPVFRGALDAIDPDCVFDEKLTLRHTADMGGNTDLFEFQWAYQPDSDGTQPALPVGEPGGGDDNWISVPAAQLVPQTGEGAVDFTIRGSGLLTLSDNWLVARYRPTPAAGTVCAGDWSEWTRPALAEGWIKRVLGRIDPFKQRAVGGGIQTAEDRFFAFQNTQINTIVSMITQAGRRYSGNVALNCANLDAFGLIEIYQTVLDRGEELSIRGTPPVDYAPANNALLLAASRIADLYLLLGNEAYADAQDPTIGLGSDSEQFGAVASSIHPFMNQTTSLIGEELALLRGRDDRLAPGVEVAPVFNRLYWNFTRDITGGEVAYALNYNIKDQSGNVDGTINAQDAARIYPQGHGDAWGHYLTGIKTYYRLLRQPNYTWVPRPEAVTVNGNPVSVDYFDERKFATIAAAKARTGAEVVQLTYRAAFTEDPNGQYLGYRDTDPQRAWGLAEWGSRTGEGAYFDWVVANAILPDVDATGEGIQKIDRTTVAELGDVAAAMTVIQAEVDKADAGLNPLGLSRNVVLFDIDPTQVVSTFGVAEPHFERVYNKAVATLLNAKRAFDYANAATQALRSQADDIAEFQQAVSDSEIDFTSRLIEVFGYPYPNDIGPGGSYPSGYDGPDYLHWMYTEPIAGEAQTSVNQVSVTVRTRDFVFTSTGDFELDDDGNPKKEERDVVFTFAENSRRLVKPAAWGNSQRRAPGEVQLANSDLVQAQIELRKAVAEYGVLVQEIEEKADQLRRRIELFDEKVSILNGLVSAKAGLNVTIIALKTLELGFRTAGENAKDAASATGTAVPDSTIGGLAVGGDFLSAIRGALEAIGNIAAGALGAAGDIAEVSGLTAEIAKETLEDGLNVRIEILEGNFEIENERAELEILFRQEAVKRLEIFQQQEAVKQAASRVAQWLAAGERILEDRARFRRQTAAATQEYRYKDMAFRIFRNDALQKYRAQFDLAAQYAYLAATAYDYETNLLPGDPATPGSVYMNRIVRSRSLGVILDDAPQVGGSSGDPGIASALARMKTNWDLNLKTRLGFNNPDLEGNLMSLRTELFRIPADPEYDEQWREVLLAAAEAGADFQSDPDVRRYALPIPGAGDDEPGLVLKFPTTINFGQNTFGLELGEGDSALDPTATTTKLRRHAIVFTGYNNVGLSSTPRVYFFPAGTDTLRSPTASQGRTREWRIVEQLVPVPFPLTEADLGVENFIPRIDNLTGEYGAIRRFGLQRAFDEDDFEPTDPASPNGIGYTTDLVSRSAWNSNWVLVIPAGVLLGDRDEAIRRFVYGIDGKGGVTDIKVFFETFAFQAFGRQPEPIEVIPDDEPAPPIDFIQPISLRISEEAR